MQRADFVGGRFTTAVPLSSGATAEVYRAYDAHLDRPVALKLLRIDDPDLSERLLREARAQARVKHPGICDIYAVGSLDGRAFIAMELIEGDDLGTAAADMTLRETVRIMAEVAEAIEAAHAAGLVHRDLKPANIMVETRADGARVARVVDFGLVRDSHGRLGARDLTAHGQWLGTPPFMAPEQARGDRDAEGPASDVYALGATLYHLLAGRPPFIRPSDSETLAAVLREPAPPLRRWAPAVPTALARIVHLCLHKAPDDRYLSAGALAADLRRFLAGRAPQLRGPGWSGGGRGRARR
ncbi:MAG: serine/threonine-protein kinase, partial [Acidobacteriota bacterium]